LVDAGKIQGSSVTTSISEKTKLVKEQEFTTKAIEVFQSKALSVAKAFGFTGYTLFNVQVNAASDEHNRGVFMPQVHKA
jgi:predicted secreted protein